MMPNCFGFCPDWSDSRATRTGKTHWRWFNSSIDEALDRLQGSGLSRVDWTPSRGSRNIQEDIISFSEVQHHQPLLRENFADSEDTDPRRSHPSFFTLM
jgi:hypothetical protein